MIILVDFDDTLCNSKDIPKGHRMGQPVPGAVAAMKRLYMTNEINILTGRRVDVPAVYEAVAKWLEYFGIPYHNITNVKPDRYDLIIDNRALHFDDWPKTLFRTEKLIRGGLDAWAYQGDTSVPQQLTVPEEPGINNFVEF